MAIAIAMSPNEQTFSFRVTGLLQNTINSCRLCFQKGVRCRVYKVVIGLNSGDKVHWLLDEGEPKQTTSSVSAQIVSLGGKKRNNERTYTTTFCRTNPHGRYLANMLVGVPSSVVNIVRYLNRNNFAADP